MKQTIWPYVCICFPFVERSDQQCGWNKCNCGVRFFVWVHFEASLRIIHTFWPFLVKLFETTYLILCIYSLWCTCRSNFVSIHILHMNNANMFNITFTSRNKSIGENLSHINTHQKDEFFFQNSFCFTENFWKVAGALLRNLKKGSYKKIIKATW